MAYDNTNRFALFPNKDRKTDKHPNLTGTLNVDGVDYFIDGWTREKDGRKYISGTIKRKEKQQGGGRSEPQQNDGWGGPQHDEDPDIPF